MSSLGKGIILWRVRIAKNLFMLWSLSCGYSLSLENTSNLDTGEIREKYSGASVLIMSFVVADDISDADRIGGKIFSVSDSILSMINTSNMELRKAEMINRHFLRFIVVVL